MPALIALIALALAAVACVLSLRALRIARQPQHPPPTTSAEPGIAETSARAKPFVIEVEEGQARREISDDGRDYALLVSFWNDSDEAVVVARCTLRVTYRTRANFLGAVDLEPRSDVEHSKADARPVFQTTLTIKPRQHPQRWLLFHTVNVIPRHCRVQEYAIVAIADDGRRYIADASLPSMLGADTDGAGPATWGWD